MANPHLHPSWRLLELTSAIRWFAILVWSFVALETQADEGLVSDLALLEKSNTNTHHVGLARVLSFKPSAPVQFELTVRDLESGNIALNLSGETDIQPREVAIHGLHPKTKYEIDFAAWKNDDGRETERESRSISFDTEALPLDFPPVAASDLDNSCQTESGIVIFPVTLWFDDKPRPDFGYLVAVDKTGKVVWFYNARHRISDVSLLPDGKLLVLNANFRDAYTIDGFGRVYQRWQASGLSNGASNATPVFLDSFHHTFSQLPNGDFLTLTTKLRQSDSYPQAFEKDSKPVGESYFVCDQVAVVRQDGWVRESHDLYDLLDPNIHSYSSLTDFWKSFYKRRINGSLRDWSHANAVCYNEVDRSLLVSVRHLDCILKIDEAGKLQWILGDPTGWGREWQPLFLKPGPDTMWPHHQHAVHWTDRGTILMYDNGNHRVRPPSNRVLAAQNRSRVVEYAIDEEQGTVTQVWEYDGGDDPFYCPFYGDVDLLPETQNMLITDGGHVESENGIPQDAVPADRQWARLIEVTRDKKVVFELTCDSGPRSRLGWSIYRSLHLADLNEIDFPVLGKAE